jgi:hypothetical protein
MIGILLVHGQSITNKHIGYTLNALTGKPPAPRDLRHRGRFLFNRLENPPARARLTRRLSDGIPSSEEQTV